MAGKKRIAAKLDLPTRDEILHKINSINKENSADPLRDKALISITYLTGARISEIINRIKPLDIEEKKYKEYKIWIIHNVKTLKQRNARKDMNRNIPIVVNKEIEFTHHVVRYMSKVPPEEPLFKMTRQWAWKIVLRHTGWYNHFFRHIRATHMTTEYGFTNVQLNQFFGWSTSYMADTYSHLNVKDLMRKMVE